MINQLPGFDVGSGGLTFTDELQQVKTPQQLAQFIARWKPLWQVEHKNKPGPARKIDSEICTLDFDLEEALLCIAKARFKACSHASSGEVCHGVEVVLPWALLTAHMIAKQYDVPMFTALHQAFCQGPHDSCF